MRSITPYIFSLILCSMFVFGFAFTASGQTDNTKGNQTITFKVFGVCDDCKKRIESAALDAKGVKKAEWDIQSNMIVLVGSSKMTAQNVAEAIAKAGYKSELCVADAKAYSKLPACCQYESGIEKH